MNKLIFHTKFFAKFHNMGVTPSLETTNSYGDGILLEFKIDQNLFCISKVNTESKFSKGILMRKKMKTLKIVVSVPETHAQSENIES